MKRCKALKIKKQRPKKQQCGFSIIFWHHMEQRWTGRRNRICVKAKCLICMKSRWIALDGLLKRMRQNVYSGRCVRCSPKRYGSDSSAWKGGRHKTSHGYIYIRPPRDHPFREEMVNCRGEIYEHRWKMALHLRRPLSTYEHVHHLDGIKSHNSLKNLELVPSHEHILITRLQSKILKLEAELNDLQSRTLV